MQHFITRLLSWELLGVSILSSRYSVCSNYTPTSRHRRQCGLLIKLWRPCQMKKITISWHSGELTVCVENVYWGIVNCGKKNPTQIMTLVVSVWFLQICSSSFSSVLWKWPLAFDARRYCTDKCMELNIKVLRTFSH